MKFGFARSTRGYPRKLLALSMSENNPHFDFIPVSSTRLVSRDELVKEYGPIFIIKGISAGGA